MTDQPKPDPQDGDFGAYNGTITLSKRAAEILTGIVQAPTPDAAKGAGDDPTASAEWNAGCDFAMTKLCSFLGVDPATVNWDAATETVDGDVLAVIGNIVHAKFGEDWCPAPPKPVPDAAKGAEHFDPKKHPPGCQPPASYCAGYQKLLSAWGSFITPPKSAPDANCHTLPNGDCISQDTCMHAVLAPDAVREALRDCREYLKELVGNFGLSSYYPVHALIDKINSALSAPVPSPDGAGELASFGHAPKPFWIIKFEDIDRGEMHFGNEIDAHTAFEKASGGGWNCTLFETVQRKYEWKCNQLVPRSPSGTGAAEPVATPQHIPFALWADKIERTTRIVTVREADSYGSAMYAAHIDCFYDFEAKRLVALLRSLATPPVRGDRELLERVKPILEAAASGKPVMMASVDILRDIKRLLSLPRSIHRPPR